MNPSLMRLMHAAALPSLPPHLRSWSKASEALGRLLDVKDGRVFERLALLCDPAAPEVGMTRRVAYLQVLVWC